MAGIVPVGGVRGHPVAVIIGLALGLVIGRDVLNEAGAGDDAHHLHPAAGAQGGHVLAQAVGHQRIVGDVPGGVDLLAHVGLLLRHLEERGAHVLAAGEEHAVDAGHGLAHVAVGQVLGLDLVGILLLEHPALLQIGVQDLAVLVIGDRGAGHPVQLHRVAAGGADDRLKGVIVLCIALPADADIGLANEGSAVLQHGLELGLGHASRPIIGEARGQAHADRRVLIVGGPGL